MTPPDWWRGARCAETDPDIFFPDKSHSTSDAKKICGRCEVSAECLAYALDHPELIGVWGGKSVRERRLMRPGTSQEVAA